MKKLPVKPLGDRDSQLPGKGFGAADAGLIAEMLHRVGIRVDEPGEPVLPGVFLDPAVGIGTAVPVPVGIDLHRDSQLFADSKDAPHLLQGKLR